MQLKGQVTITHPNGEGMGSAGTEATHYILQHLDFNHVWNHNV